MKKLNKLAMPLVAAALLGSAPFFALAQNAAQNNNTVVTAAGQDWSSPPAGTEQAQQGYRDGIQAAKLDTLTHRTVDAKVSHLYVHPPVKGNDAVNQYRQSFVAGYNAAVAHATAS
jgi:hypothetical protein